jgi:hypothetical protein
MSRALWFVAGAGAGVYGMVKARRLAEAVTPDGLRDRRQAYALGARTMLAEAAAGAAEKEIELRERLGLPSLEVSTSRGRGSTDVELEGSKH